MSSRSSSPFAPITHPLMGSLTALNPVARLLPSFCHVVSSRRRRDAQSFTDLVHWPARPGCRLMRKARAAPPPARTTKSGSSAVRHSSNLSTRRRPHLRPSPQAPSSPGSSRLLRQGYTCRSDSPVSATYVVDSTHSVIIAPSQNPDSCPAAAMLDYSTSVRGLNGRGENPVRIGGLAVAPWSSRAHAPASSSQRRSSLLVGRSDWSVWGNEGLMLPLPCDTRLDCVVRLVVLLGSFACAFPATSSNQEQTRPAIVGAAVYACAATTRSSRPCSALASELVPIIIDSSVAIAKLHLRCSCRRVNGMGSVASRRADVEASGIGLPAERRPSPEARENPRVADEHCHRWSPRLQWARNIQKSAIGYDLVLQIGGGGSLVYFERPQNWEKEMRVHSALKHENVLEFINAVVVELKHKEIYYPGIYMLMELAAGGDCSIRLLRTGEFRTSLRTFTLANSLRESYDYIHQEGVCHRDLKPENLLLDAKGTLKISDFGLSAVYKLKADGRTRTLSERCGSLPYVAPELANDVPYNAEPVDVWGCGVILFTLLVGSAYLFFSLDFILTEPQTRHTMGRTYDAKSRVCALRQWDDIPRGPVEQDNRTGSRELIEGMLTVDPTTLHRFTIADIFAHEW
ncbi:kinase-like domain-containing protein, partial [Ephemerocybe angulata]